MPSLEQDLGAHPSSIQWVPIAKMRVSPQTQAHYTPARAQEIAADFDPDAYGILTVNLRLDGFYYVIDGQHRMRAIILMGWEGQSVECRVFTGLSTQEEAHIFLLLARHRKPNACDQFRIGVEAGWTVETAIAKVLDKEGFTYGMSGNRDAHIQAVGALKTVYNGGGTEVLARTLRLLRDGFGRDARSFRAEMIKGLGLVLTRFGKHVDDGKAIARFSSVPLGVVGVSQKAATLRAKFGRGVDECVAASIVEILNAGRTGAKLGSWWA